jgi:hypothetical protein
LSLADGMCDLLSGHYLLLGEDLHSVNSFGVAFPDLEYLPKGAPADEFEKLKVAWSKRTFILEGELRMKK